MIRQSGHGFTVTHTLDEQVKIIQDLSKATDEKADQCLEAIGQQVLSWTWEDYRVKARGGTDPAGNKWRPITEAAMRSRLSKLQSYKNASPASKKQQVAVALGRYEIGVDTGRLVNSLEVGRGYLSDTILDVRNKSVRVGSAVKYAGYFNAARPIIDERNLTPDRLKELEELVEEILQPQGDL